MQQQLDNIRVGAIATCVPSRVVTNDDLANAFGEKAMSRFGKSTGIHERRVATNQSALDLCCFAAEKLFESGFDRADVDGVVFVSQTPEYILPASAAIAQDRLGLRHDIAAFDVNLGCSGYVYGLLIAGKLLAGQSGGSILLLVGDTISRICGAEDRATRPIFGDAGSATIIEFDENAGPWTFDLATDGSGADAIAVPASGFASESSDINRAEAQGGHLVMDGSRVFTFATTRVPQMIGESLDRLGWAPDDVDTMVLHQANTLILNTVARKTGIATDKSLNHLAKFGNTSCASIPLAMTQERERTFGRTVLCGFGVGLSWATMCGELGQVPTFHIEVE